MKIQKLTVTLLTGVLLSLTTHALAQNNVKLSENGKALQAIVVAQNASEPTKQHAATLAEYLGRISGATFETQNGDGARGIAVGIAKDFPALGLGKEFDASDAARREEYLMRSTPTGVLLIGASETAVQHAVWDFLHRLGYRHFFPGAHWEVVPKNANLSIAVDDREKPDYLTRRIWFTYGTWPENNARMSVWNARNRAASSVVLNTGHAFAAIINRNKAAFAAHPEYISPFKGERKAPTTPREVQSVQFDISNPGLRQLVIDDALRFFEKNPEADSYSVDPNDGGAWGHSEAELKIGSVSDRVTLLANEVAEAVNKKYPGKYIAFYAYNQHSPPPSIRVHPNVVVSVATAFISGGFSVDQLIEGWQKQGATIGMREYYSIIHWDKDMPNSGRAANLDYLTRTIPHFYNYGARFMSAESSDNWGPHGLGYYLAARMLWDVDEAKNTPALIEDFLEKSFGPAKEPMRQYYGLINRIGNTQPRPMSEDYVGSLYRALQSAYKLTNDPGIRARLDDLALYARYVELYLEYAAAKGEARQVTYENLIRHAYRIHDTHMLHSLAIYRTGLRDKSVKIPPEAHWQKPAKDKKTGEPVNPWKQSTPHAAAEIQEIVNTGVIANKLLDFEPKTFTDELAPAQALALNAVTPSGFPRLRGSQNFYVWMDAPGTINLSGVAGTIYNSRGPAKISLFSVDEPEVEEDDEQDAAEQLAPVPIVSAELPPDAQSHDVAFRVNKAGLYRVHVTDRMMGTQINFPEGTKVVVKSALGATTAFGSRWKAYFYVPKGTKAVGGFAYGGGLIRDADGKVIFNYPAKDGYFSIPVPPGQDEKLWAFEAANGQIGLMTTPPYLARGEKELLLPREVVEADR